MTAKRKINRGLQRRLLRWLKRRGDRGATWTEMHRRLLLMSGMPKLEIDRREPVGCYGLPVPCVREETWFHPATGRWAKVLPNDGSDGSWEYVGNRFEVRPPLALDWVPHDARWHRAYRGHLATLIGRYACLEGGGILDGFCRKEGDRYVWNGRKIDGAIVSYPDPLGILAARVRDEPREESDGLDEML